MIHVLARLQPACAAVAVSARAGSGAGVLGARLGLDLLHDDPLGPEGPLAGVRAGLAWAAGRGAEALVVAPCDAPFLPEDIVARLAAGLGAVPAAYAETVEGPEPLCSAWRIGLLGDVEQALAGGKHPSVIGFLKGLGATAVPFTDAAAFRNANRPDDLTRP